MNLELKIGYFFKNKNLLIKSLTHKSLLINNKNNYNNEVYEFLGDSILMIIITDIIYNNNNFLNEEQLTYIRSIYISRARLAIFAKKILLNKYIISSNKKINIISSVLSNTLESLIGAIYLDGGINSVRYVIFNIFEIPFKKCVSSKIIINSKIKIQKLMQFYFHVIPKYKVLEKLGDLHIFIFIIGLYVKRKFIAITSGTNLKKASKRSALHSLRNIYKYPEEYFYNE